eukprot:10543805-Alexandrium_andersonii.AAC.1
MAESDPQRQQLHATAKKCQDMHNPALCNCWAPPESWPGQSSEGIAPTAPQWQSPAASCTVLL